MSDHRADALTTCQELSDDLPRFLEQIRRFSWAPSAPQYDVARSNGSNGPIEHHRTQLVADPARNAFLAFSGHIRATETVILDAGWQPAPTRTADRKLTLIARALRSPMPMHRKQVADASRLLGLARIIQLHWTVQSEEMRPEQRACRICNETAMGSRPRAGACTSCAGFYARFKRYPTQQELRRRTGVTWWVTEDA